jgi:hypothetical protein
MQSGKLRRDRAAQSLPIVLLRPAGNATMVEMDYEPAIIPIVSRASAMTCASGMVLPALHAR